MNYQAAEATARRRLQALHIAYRSTGDPRRLFALQDQIRRMELALGAIRDAAARPPRAQYP